MSAMQLVASFGIDGRHYAHRTNKRLLAYVLIRLLSYRTPHAAFVSVGGVAKHKT